MPEGGGTDSEEIVLIDPEKRKRLDARRRQLQEELARQARRDTIAGELRLFERRGIAYRLIYETAPDRHFNVTGGLGQVDWNGVEGRTHLPVGATDEASSWLVRLAGQAAEPGGEVVMLWSNGNSPAVGVKFADIDTCSEVIASDFVTWVISEKGLWLIEYTCDGGWNYGLAGN